jgi:Xaa-Pro aminopeptidase
MKERRSPLLDRPVMRDQFRKELRGRLMSEAVVVLGRRPTRLRFPALLRPALAAAVILVLVGAGATNAAASSLPGDPLYAVKRVSENVQVAFTLDEVARMHLLSQLADRRLAELAEIAKHRPSGASTATQEYADAVERFADALDDLRAASNEEKREAAQALAEAARAKHKAVLDEVKGQLPAVDQSDVQDVIEREAERTSPAANPGRGGTGGAPSNVSPRPTPKK